ncbi:Gfo/Idh/MocA family oxidoreductase [Chryseobacterium sp. SIMBA_029]
MNISILGTGFMGKKHKSILEHIPNVYINAEIDQHQNDQPAIHFHSLNHFLEARPNTDLIVIATPNHLHFQHAKTLIEHGYHVLIEKPFVFNLEQARILQEVSLNNNCQVFLVMQNRLSSVTRFLQELVTSGAFGKIYNIQFNAFWNRGEKYYIKDSWKGKKSMDGGILFTQFSHLIDLLCHAFDDEFNVLFKDLSSFRNFSISEIEDTAILILEGKRGSKVSINFTTAVFEKNQETSLNVIAEKGTLKISGQYFNEIIFQHIANHSEEFSIPPTSNEDNLREMYLEIFKSLKGEDNCAIHLNDGIPLVTLLENIYS